MSITDLFLGGLDIQRLEEVLIGNSRPLTEVLTELEIHVDHERVQMQLGVELGLYQCPCCKLWFVDKAIDASGYCPEDADGICED